MSPFLCPPPTSLYLWTKTLILYTDDIVRGPSGQGLTTGYFPEMAASSVGSTVAATIAYDQLRAQAFLDYLDAVTPANSEGTLSTVPTVFGGNFQARTCLLYTSPSPRD